MFSVSCPGCGASVSFRSSASVMAVCSYCQTTALKDASHSENIGQISEVLEDFSPLQLGTSGVFQGLHFSLIGRIQLRYDDGQWNEWYALMDDGSGGWLSDASGQYVFTHSIGQAQDSFAFNELRTGLAYQHDGKKFRATDIRTATCIGGQGELPFVVGNGWQARVADFRTGADFLTLDYSDGTPPECYIGKAVTLSDLQCQLLRSDDQVADTAGKYKGTIQALSCPNCGSPVNHAAGRTTHLVCPACHAEVAISGMTSTVLAKHDELEAVTTTLELGSIANIHQQRYTVIGVLIAEEVNEADSSWQEYLLYHPQQGFLWLVETDTGWEKVHVLNEEWPTDFNPMTVKYQGQSLNKLWQYQARVIWAAGSFNWRVKIGDETSLTDYKNTDHKLTLEQTRHEITWSHAEKLELATLKEWFGDQFDQEASAEAITNSSSEGVGAIFWWVSGFLWLFNLPILIFGHGSWIVTAIAWLALWLLAKGIA